MADGGVTWTVVAFGFLACIALLSAGFDGFAPRNRAATPKMIVAVIKDGCCDEFIGNDCMRFGEAVDYLF